MWKLGVINVNLVWLFVKNANPYTLRNALASTAGEINLTEKQDPLARLPWSAYLLPASC